MRYFKDSFAEWGLDENSITASFFYRHREGELQTNHYSMIWSIFYDILHQEESFFHHFQSEYRKYQELGYREWPYESLKKVFASIGDHPRAEQLTLVLDAVDESDHADRFHILRLLFGLYSGNNHLVVRVFIASRPIAEMVHLVNQSHNFIKLQEETVRHNSTYLCYSSGPGLALTGELFLRAKDHITEHAQGVFLWVHLIGMKLLTHAQ